MKTLATIALSLIAIIASLVLVLSSLCAISGGPLGRDRFPSAIYALVALAVVIASMRAISRMNRKS